MRYGNGNQLEFIFSSEQMMKWQCAHHPLAPKIQGLYQLQKCCMEAQDFGGYF
jgi:hypothetical protein